METPAITPASAADAAPPPPPVEILDTVRWILAGLLQREIDAIDPAAELEALGVDSLALIELSVSLEERFGLAMPPAGSPADLGIRTVADVAAFVQGRLASDAGGR